MLSYEFWWLWLVKVIATYAAQHLQLAGHVHWYGHLIIRTDTNASCFVICCYSCHLVRLGLCTDSQERTGNELP